MNIYEFILGILVITGIVSIVRAKYGIVHRHKGEDYVGPHGGRPDPEAERLRDEVKRLKERVAVLERLATDGSTALEREFDKLKQIDRD